MIFKVRSSQSPPSIEKWMYVLLEQGPNTSFERKKIRQQKALFA